MQADMKQNNYTAQDKESYTNKSFQVLGTTLETGKMVRYVPQSKEDQNIVEETDMQIN